MRAVNQMTQTLRLRDYMTDDDGWGNQAGREVNKQLVRVVERSPQTVMFRISLDGVRRVDVSFARESVIELALRYRGERGFCLVDLGSHDDIDAADLLDNWRMAADNRQQPITLWTDEDPQIIGPEPSKSAQELLSLVLKRQELATPEAAKVLKKELNNVSTRLKQLKDRGFILRSETISPSGGVEYRYRAIG
jgi:hypothetical protein